MKLRIYPFGLSPQCPQQFRRRIVSYSGHGGEFKGDTGIAVYKMPCLEPRRLLCGRERNREGLGSGRSP